MGEPPGPGIWVGDIWLHVAQGEGQDDLLLANGKFHAERKNLRCVEERIRGKEIKKVLRLLLFVATSTSILLSQNRPHRLAWPRTLGSQPKDTGSNPVGATNYTTSNQRGREYSKKADALRSAVLLLFVVEKIRDTAPV